MSENPPSSDLAAGIPADSPRRLDRARMALVICFLLAMTAGAAAALLVTGHVKPGHGGGGMSSWFAGNLNLSAQQQEQMRAIWSPPANGPQPGESRHALEQQRDAAIRALLSGEQVAAYDRIIGDYTQKSDELSKQRHEWFKQAVDKTRQILTPEQQTKFDAFLKERSASWSGHHNHSATEPTTRASGER